MAIYLNTEDAAIYLGLKARKLYDLAAAGEVPCSKVTGKWLFPREALDRWVESGLATVPGFNATEPPAIVGGSHDPLLEWAARHSGCGLALLPEGSAAGLERLAQGTVMMAAIHLHGAVEDSRSNIAALETAPQFHDAVLIHFARREQGLMLAPGNPLAIASLADAIARSARFGMRQGGAGAHLLLLSRLAALGASLDELHRPTGSYATGPDLAFAIRAGDIDCGVATRAVANANGLDFLPLDWEHFDLALRRRSYFEAGPQKLFALMADEAFRRQAERLGGYDISQAGRVRLNR